MSGNETGHEAVEILADDDCPGGYLLLVDRVRQSYVDLADPTHLEFPYVRALAEVVDAFPPGPLRVLHLGGGAGSLARYVAHTRPGSRQCLAEPDPTVLDLVDRRLPYPPGTAPEIVPADARVVVERAGRGWDLVVLDAFRGGQVPPHLTTRDFFAAVGDILAPAGVLAANLMDAPGLYYTRRVAAGMVATWPELVVRAEPEVWADLDYGNVVVVAGHDLPMAVALDDEPREFLSRTYSAASVGEFLAGAQAFTTTDTRTSPQPPDSDWRV